MASVNFSLLNREINHVEFDISSKHSRVNVSLRKSL